MRVRIMVTFVTVLIAAALAVQAAHAQQAFTTYLSGTGDDAGLCARDAPCATLTYALTKTAAGGHVVCLSSGFYGGPVIITKAVTVDCRGHHAEFRPAGQFNTGDGIRIELPGGSGQDVYLRGLTYISYGMEYGVRIVSAGKVIIDEMTIRGFSVANIAAIGGQILHVTNTNLVNDSGGNILIRPTGSFRRVANIERTTMIGGTFGVKADGSGQAFGEVDVEAIESSAIGHINNGFLATSGAGQSQVRFKITRSVARSNGAYGVAASGAQAFMIVDGSSLTRNGTGLGQLDSATVATYGNNGVNFNTTNTAGTITAIPLR